ncbi:MAG: glutamine-hydrolyzing GMP synthase [Dehalococcoidia bacterium]|nr:glutamine-hydrolyzing GMP synthase [Dehalococcoidia bacterium]
MTPERPLPRDPGEDNWVAAAVARRAADHSRVKESIVILDFGSQYSLLIARRVRECGVYCELLPHDAPFEAVADLNPRGFILSGGPSSVYNDDAPVAPSYVFESELPVLGICYGMQLLAQQLGGQVAPGARREYGPAIINVNETSSLFADLPSTLAVWMSHGDRVTDLPPGFRSLAHTTNSPHAVIADNHDHYGLQFHPEVVHTPQGPEILRNFLFNVCRAQGGWTARSILERAIEDVRRQVGEGRAICALSGGVDSSVAAAITHAAIGDRLTCVFVDNGVMRQGEPQQVQETFHRNLGIQLHFVDAGDRFLAGLAGITDPETKRKRIGETFVRVFEETAAEFGHIDHMIQGTTYPDVIESGQTASKGKTAQVIKTHHNVGGLPEDMVLRVVEPLRYLFKDEVRKVGLEVGLPQEIVGRQPFPGPGLAIRIIGEVTKEKVATLQAADAIVMEEITDAGLYDELWQAFAVLTDTRSVGVQGDFRTYGNVIALRAVTADDAMTADWARLPYDVLARISNRIVNEVRGVNRVVYDITSKPPGTIEWE